MNTITPTIVIEGNIGSGKSTLAEILLNHDESIKAQIEFYEEPVHMWQDVKGLNLLREFYEQPKKFAFCFESYIQLTMLHNHEAKLSQGKSVKLLERSLHSANKIFVENLKANNVLNQVEYDILQAWYKHLSVKENGMNVDLTIYLRTDPKNCQTRIKERAREGEVQISIEYLTQLSSLYDNWLFLTDRVIKDNIVSLYNDGSIEQLKREVEVLMPLIKNKFNI